MRRTNKREWKKAKKNYWGGMYDNITRYNNQHHTLLSNVNIRKAIDQVM